MKDVDLTQLPAFMLLRKSQQDKEEEKRAKLAGREYDALDNQRQALLGLAARMGVTVPPENVVAEIKSGKLLKNRKDFLVLLDRIKALPKPGALLLTVNVARITRGLLTERGEIQDLFIDKQVLVATMQGITNLQVADQRLMYEFQGAMAHHYLLQYKEQVARTRAVHVDQGRLRTGSVPFGYVWDKGTKLPRPHHVEFPILQQMCQDVFVLSIQSTAEKYGVPDQRVWRALRSPMICGWPAKTTRMGENGRIHYLPREEWVWPKQQAPYPEAISRSEWERLQKVLDGRQKGVPGLREVNHWCRDVVEFVDMLGRVTLAGYKSPYAAYPIYVRQPVRGGKKQYVSRGDVHEAVIKAIEPVIQSNGFLLLVRELEARREEGPAPDEEVLLKEQERLKQQLVNLRRMESDPDTSPSEIPGIRDLRKELIVQVDRIGPRLEKIRSRAPILSRAEAEELSLWAKRIKDVPFREGWAAIADVEKRVLVNCIVEKVEVEVTKPNRGPWLERRITVRLQPWVSALRA